MYVVTELEETWVNSGYFDLLMVSELSALVKNNFSFEVSDNK